MRRLAPSVTLAWLGTILLGAFAIPASAADPITLTVGPGRIGFIGDDLDVARDLVVAVTGGEESWITFEMLDVYVSQDGSRATAGYGTTPGTLAGAFAVPERISYVPDGATQTFTVPLRVDPGAVIAPRAGVLTVLIGPKAEGVLVQAAGVQVEIVAGPAGGAGPGAVAPGDLGLSLAGPTTTEGRPFTLIGALLPRLPWVIGRGPIEAQARVRNTGSTLLDVSVRYEFSRVSPLALLPIGALQGRPIVVVEQAPRFLLPGESFQDRAQSRNMQDGNAIEALPFIGLVRVTAVATGQVGDLSVMSETGSKMVLVFPWAEALVLAAAWLGVRRMRRRTIDLRYANQPIEVVPGTHRRSKWWRVVRGPALVGARQVPPRRAAPAPVAPGQRVDRTAVERPKRRLLRDMSEDEIRELAGSEQRPGGREPSR